ncbi:MAG: class I SAM-dependent methyltransferase [Thermoproteota archaeon]|nr:class I SAM-dependent methyltransferase [Thermoproteota archaeon]MDQ3807430.1 class I SAM-dependent methyltransferase [Thermoproteota archaeon]
MNRKRSADFARLWRYSVGFYGVWIAHIGKQMMLFDRLATKPMSIEELVTSTKFYPAAVKAWCSAAQAYRFVTAKNGKLQMDKKMRPILINKASPDYLGGQFSYLALRSIKYGAFEELFRHGKVRKTTSTMNAVQEATDWDHYAFLAAARRHKKLHQMLSAGCKVLDVGCGTGSMLAKIHKMYPKSSLIGIDRSSKALAMACQIAHGNPAITLMKMPSESMKFANEFDIVFLGESLYMMKDKGTVLFNCWRALRNCGTIAIMEGLVPKSNLHSPASQLIMGMQLDFALQGQMFMNKNDVALLLNNRFSKTRFEDLGGNVYLVTAMKK